MFGRVQCVMDGVQAVDGDCQSAAGADKGGCFVKGSVGGAT